VDSLAASIHAVRPALIPDPPKIAAIPTTFPEGDLAVPIAHGLPWGGHENISGW